MKDRIKKFFKNRSVDDLIIAVVPASMIALYLIHHNRGQQIESIKELVMQDGAGYVGLTVRQKNGKTKFLPAIDDLEQ